MSAIPMLDEDECILWTGYITPNGYGRRTIKSRQYYAHRVAWEEANGPIPDGLTVDHLCRVKACINPAHMELVTVNENTRRQVRKTGCKIHGVMDRRTPLGRPYCSICMRRRNAARRRAKGVSS